ncbi:MAG: polyprenyl synthetase family protein, partial [Pseudomonadota bacterium]
MTTIDRLMASVREDMERVEQMLLSSSSSDILMLRDICKHILSSGGKRLRPLILLLTARFCDYAGHNHIPLA